MHGPVGAACGVRFKRRAMGSTVGTEHRWAGRGTLQGPAGLGEELSLWSDGVSASVWGVCAGGD